MLYEKGRVIAPVVGAFAEMSPDTYAIAGLVSSALAKKKVLTENIPM